MTYVQIKKEITEHHGTFTADFDVKKVTHLVCSRAGGDKYKIAKAKGIPLVQVQWVFDSLSKGEVIK